VLTTATSHVFAASVLFDALATIGTEFAVFVEPFYGFARSRTQLPRMGKVSTSHAVHMSARACHNTVSDITRLDNGDNATLAIQNSLYAAGERNFSIQFYLFPIHVVKHVGRQIYLQHAPIVRCLAHWTN